MQGVWDFRTVTPLERPAEFAGNPVLTEAEAAAYERRMVNTRNADTNRDKTESRGVTNGTATTADLALAYNDFWYDRGTTTGRTAPSAAWSGRRVGAGRATR